MNTLRSLSKNFLNMLMKIVTNEFVLIILMALLVMFAINIIFGLALALVGFFFFATIVYIVKNSTVKRTHIICFVICFCVSITFLGLLISKTSAIPYNFGSPMSVSKQEEINYCFDKGIKHVSFSPKKVEKTQYIEKTDVKLRANRTMGPNDGRIRFYYSIVELDGINLLVKHSQETLRGNETIVAYLSKLDSRDMRVYNDFCNDKNLHKSVVVYDNETLNSDLFGWRMWTIGQCVIFLAGIAMCIYIFLKYKKRFYFSSRVTATRPIKSKPVKEKNHLSKDKQELEKRLRLLEDFGVHNKIMIDNISINNVEEVHKKDFNNNLDYCKNNKLEDFIIMTQKNIASATNKRAVKVIQKGLTSEFEKIAYWNNILKEYI